MERRSSIRLALLVAMALAGTTCNMKDTVVGPGQSSEVIPTEAQTGTLVPVPGTGLGMTDLKVISLAGTSSLDGGGKFTVEAPTPEKFQQLFVQSKTTGNVVYIGLVDPVSKTATVNDTSTVLSILLFNPVLAHTSQSDRQEYLRRARLSPLFPQLLLAFQQGIQSNANTALNFDANPTLYQLAVLLMKEVVESMQSAKLLAKTMVYGGEPTIEDAAGDEIDFVNPRHVHYCAGVYPNDGALKEVVLVKRQKHVVGMKWGWPFVTWNEPERTTHNLGNGSFRIYLAKGLDFTKFLSPDDPVGRATIYNTAEALITTFDLVVGLIVTPKIITLPQHFHISQVRLYELLEAIRKGDALGFVGHFCKLIVDNAEELAYWLWSEARDQVKRDAARLTAEATAKIAQNVGIALKLLSFANGAGPFYYDLFFAPKEVTYYITQTNGLVSTSTKNLAPEASFTVSPPAGIIGTAFQFDGSTTVDDHDNLGKLQFQWDWESDGTWDTQWSTSPIATHSYQTSKSYTVTIGAKDGGGLIGTAIHTLNVGGGAGTASHVKLFMDAAPWQSSALITMLASLGFSVGTGVKQYEVLGSDKMASAALLPGTDLVILANDQPQQFYGNYAQNQVKFNNFVFGGGALFWEACDLGWNNGSMKTAGVILPGNVTTSEKLDRYNSVPTPSLPLVSGLPTSMDHNYASHERFVSLPDGATIYCVDSDGMPTLVEFNLGSGWVIMTGQPLEHQYDRVYGAPDMENLLPRIVSYFTSTPLTSVRKELPGRSTVASKR